MNGQNHACKWALAALVLAAASGCTVGLRTGSLLTPVGNPQGSLIVEDRAEGMKQVVGLVHFSLFYIPIAPVTVDGEADREMMRVIRETVERMGYTAYNSAQAADCAGCPRLAVRIDKFAFHDYTWMFPQVITWGKIALTVTVTDPGGRVLWTKSYEEKAKDEMEMEFDPVVNEALNQLLNQMIRDMATDEFQQAVWGAPPEKSS